jgi:hypothetical protein
VIQVLDQGIENFDRQIQEAAEAHPIFSFLNLCRGQER